jgi:site-specific recombinase XerD
VAVPYILCNNLRGLEELQWVSGVSEGSGVEKLVVRMVAGSRFRLQVVRADGLPEIALTVFAGELLTMLAEGSVRAYLREVLAFANWAGRDGVAAGHAWRLYGDPREVRNLVREYLTTVGECRITQRPDTLGVRVAYVNVTNETRINVRLLLAALKRLYESLGEQGFYAFDNPLVHADAARAIAEFRRGQRSAVQAAMGRLPMPPASGVDEPPSGIRLSENYFRLVQREWQPKSIDDPGFPNQVYTAGKKYGWGIRELCAVRTLFESGARISEVFDLTAADWAASGFTNRFLASNKGSFGRRVKTIIVAGPTAKLYRKYFDEGRAPSATAGVRVGQLPALLRRDPERLATIRIFMTARGTPMTARLFRDHYWKPALKAAGIDADPHLCRHWFVTHALGHIERTVRTDAELTRRKQELIQYMAWRSGEQTLKAYEHVQRGDSFARRLRLIHNAMHRREREAGKAMGEMASIATPGDRTVLDHDLAFLLGNDNDD